MEYQKGCEKKPIAHLHSVTVAGGTFPLFPIGEKVPIPLAGWQGGRVVILVI